MTIDKAFDVVYRLSQTMTRLISLGNKIDAHKHPQQVDAVFAILKIVDSARINQIKIAKDYRKTADRLGLLRSMYDARNEPSVSLSDFYQSLEDKPISVYDKKTKPNQKETQDE